MLFLKEIERYVLILWKVTLELLLENILVPLCISAYVMFKLMKLQKISDDGFSVGLPFIPCLMFF